MSKRRGTLVRRGCVGCFLLTAIAVVVALALGVIGLLESRREPEMRADTQSSPIPERGLPRLESGTDRDAEGPSFGALDVERIREVPIAEPGSIVLDVSMVRLSLEPAPAGSPIRLEADYDANSYRLDQQLTVGDDDAWSYRLRFGPRGVLARFVLAGDRLDPKLRLFVPRDTPIRLTGSIGTGESQLELGGLWITDLELELGVGEHGVSFAEPLLLPMATFDIDASVGEFSVRRLGNASPQSTRIDHDVGEVRVDLSGRWMRDGRAEVRCGIGECRVALPRTARVVLDTPSVMIGEVRSDLRWAGQGEELPRLELSASARLGELEVR